MPRITSGGVSNQFVDPDFIAEPGTPVEVALDEGRPDVGSVNEPNPEHEPDGQDVDRDRQAESEQPKGNDDEETGRDALKPSKAAPAKKAAPTKSTNQK